MTLPADLTVRTPSQGDVAGIAALVGACDESYRSWAPPVASARPVPGRAHVAVVFTHPDRWRQGIAGGLLAIAEDAMRDARYREVQLWTPRDAAAWHFYAAAGWEPDGREQWLAELGLPIVAYLKPL